MSGNKILLDTNIVIELFRGNIEISNVLYKYEIFIPTIVIGELYFGAYGSSILANSKKRIVEINDFLQNCKILEITFETSKTYGKIKNQLKLSGTPIPENDIWIGAISHQFSLPIYTLDSHFEKIKDIQLHKA